MSQKIGVIGLGLMGRPMARNLLAAGFELVVHNRSRGAVDELLTDYPDVLPALTPADVAKHARTIITMLPDSADVESVVLGKDGVIENVQPGDLIIDMSTISPATAIDIHSMLTSKGAGSLDAPVSGGDKGAIEGTLSIMVGGDEADVQRAMPLFTVLGTTITHCGGPGAGQTVKSCNQIVVGIAYQAVSEALVLGSKAGVDPKKIMQVLDGGLASTAVLRLRGEAMVSGDFNPGGRAELHLKDLGIALRTGKTLNVPLPVTAIVRDYYQTLQAKNRGHLDHSALLTLVEEAANHRVTRSGA
jgi:2-hydroxy-3-oxopropionate reductase